jgi:hypothetical protein
MVKGTVVAILVVSALAVASAREGDVIAQFNGGIGVIPVTGGAERRTRMARCPTSS